MLVIRRHLPTPKDLHSTSCSCWNRTCKTLWRQKEFFRFNLHLFVRDLPGNASLPPTVHVVSHLELLLNTFPQLFTTTMSQPTGEAALLSPQQLFVLPNSSTNEMKHFIVLRHTAAPLIWYTRLLLLRCRVVGYCL